MTHNHARPGAPPSADEQAGIDWWKSRTQQQRAQALTDAGWTAQATDLPSVSDCWKVFNLRVRTDGRKPRRYVMLFGRCGRGRHLFDTLNKTRISNYATAEEAERHAIALNCR